MQKKTFSIFCGRRVI